MNVFGDRKRSQFEMLVVEHHVQLRAFVRSLAVNPDWVDDIAQEAFLTAFREWDSFDESRDFGKWIRGIAANIVRNEIRKHARRNRLLHTELADIAVASPCRITRASATALGASHPRIASESWPRSAGKSSRLGTVTESRRRKSRNVSSSARPTSDRCSSGFGSRSSNVSSSGC